MISTEKLEFQLQRNALSMYEVSKMTGISKVSLSKIRTGATKNPRPSTIRRLAEALNCQPLDLMEPTQ